MDIEIIVMLLLVVGIIILLFLEPINIAFIALFVPVILMILNHWTQVTTEDVLSGFSNTATITVLAMFILSAAVRKHGFVQVLGNYIQTKSKNNHTLSYFIIIMIAALVAAILNNTPVVALFIPLVINIARKNQTSPSKILIPLSYASMMGGTLTLIGSSTNLLASEISGRLIDHSFSMFEFSSLGFVVLIVGITYLMTIGKKLTPARIKPEKDITDVYKMNDQLTILNVQKDSPFIGRTLQNNFDDIKAQFKIIDIIRDEKDVNYDPSRRTIKQGDNIIIRSNEEAIVRLIEEYGCQLAGENRLNQANIEEDESEKELIEIVIPIGSTVIGKSVRELGFSKKYRSIIFSIRRKEDINFKNLSNIKLRAGDILLLKGDSTSFEDLEHDYDFITIKKKDFKNYHKGKMIASLSILLGVILLAVIGVLPIVISALLGVVIIVGTGLIKPQEAYKAVDWSVIFLLAGLIPLGVAMEKTGSATFLANQIMNVSSGLPNIVTLGLFYLFTALLTNVLSNNASVILMIPIAVEAATQMGANPFAFVLVVTFAASTAFLTPVGYQTNLMVYGPGGYKFSDYFKVGAPLQIIMAIVTPVFINLFWGV